MNSQLPTNNKNKNPGDVNSSVFINVVLENWIEDSFEPWNITEEQIEAKRQEIILNLVLRQGINNKVGRCQPYSFDNPLYIDVPSISEV